MVGFAAAVDHANKHLGTRGVAVVPGVAREAQRKGASGPFSLAICGWVTELDFGDPRCHLTLCSVWHQLLAIESNVNSDPDTSVVVVREIGHVEGLAINLPTLSDDDGLGPVNAVVVADLNAPVLHIIEVSARAE